MRGRLWLIALGFTLLIFIVLWSVGQRGKQATPVATGRPTDAVPVKLGTDRCVTCHHRQTPTIVEQWSKSRHARNNASCADCHRVSRDHPLAKEHFGDYVSTQVTPNTCGTCHPRETRQFAFSRHSLPAWTALVGYEHLEPRHQSAFNQITEIRRAPDGGELPTGFVGATRNALYDIEDEAITRLACQACHGIGKPNVDGSAGNCNACHLRHEFSLAQVRKPQTCSRCHIGPDHPQYEIYEESSHGILYHTQGHEWNWEERPGRLGVDDMPAATCQICHMSGFGGQSTTHDVGDRLSWFLFAEISEHRPNWQENRERMKSICGECHSRPFIDEQYAAADALTVAINDRVSEAKTIVESLVASGAMTAEPFDHPIKFIAFDLWHHYGRTAKFGAWMQGPDYTQWHGIYPLLEKLAELKEFARAQQEKIAAGNAEQPRASAAPRAADSHEGS